MQAETGPANMTRQEAINVLTETVALNHNEQRGRFRAALVALLDDPSIQLLAEGDSEEPSEEITIGKILDELAAWQVMALRQSNEKAAIEKKARVAVVAVNGLLKALEDDGISVDNVPDMVIATGAKVLAALSDYLPAEGGA